MHRTIIEAPFAADTSPVITATLVDEVGVALTPAVLTTMTLTLLDRDALTVVNGRDHVDVLNANGGTISPTGGAFAFHCQPADLAKTDDTRLREGRAAVIRWTWDGGTESGAHEVWFDVMSLAGA